MSLLKKRFFGFSVLTILIVVIAIYFAHKMNLLSKAMGVVGGGGKGNGGEMPGAVGAVNAT